MAEIKVSSAALRASASVILNQAVQFNQMTAAIKNGMNSMKNQWMGAAADAFINRFNTLSKSFDGYLKNIQSYGDFLNKAAADFEATESILERTPITGQQIWNG